MPAETPISDCRVLAAHWLQVASSVAMQADVELELWTRPNLQPLMGPIKVPISLRIQVPLDLYHRADFWKAETATTKNE